MENLLQVEGRRDVEKDEEDCARGSEVENENGKKRGRKKRGRSYCKPSRGGTRLLAFFT